MTNRNSDISQRTAAIVAGIGLLIGRCGDNSPEYHGFGDAIPRRHSWLGARDSG
jgi:hypothetical protein